MLFNVVKTILMVLEVITCLALVAAVLLQKTKSQGMGLAFGSGMGESLFGAQVGNVMTKITIILATVFLVNTAILAKMGANTSGSSVTDGMPSEKSAPAQYPSSQGSPFSSPITDQTTVPVTLPAVPITAEGVAPVAPIVPPVATVSEEPSTPAPVLPPMPEAPKE